MAVLTCIVTVAVSVCVTDVPFADAANWPSAKVVAPLPSSKAMALLVASAHETLPALGNASMTATACWPAGTAAATPPIAAPAVAATAPLVPAPVTVAVAVADTAVMATLPMSEVLARLLTVPEAPWAVEVATAVPERWCPGPRRRSRQRQIARRSRLCHWRWLWRSAGAVDEPVPPDPPSRIGGCVDRFGSGDRDVADARPAVGAGGPSIAQPARRRRRR